jgi:EmrB/QacA subfamily drug resistance transporter
VTLTREAELGQAKAAALKLKSGLRGNPVWTLVVVGLGIAMVGLDATVVVIANPYIASSLHCSLSDLQWVANAYLLALAVLLVPMGKVGDRFGRRLLFLVGVAGFGVTSLAVGKVGSIGGVIAFRALLGVFGAMLMPSTLAIVRSAFPTERLNLAVGMWGGAAAVSVAAGPVVAGLLVQHASWEWCFFINLPVGLLSLVLGLVVLAESRDWHHARGFDLRGLVLVGAGLFCLVFGLVKADGWGWGDAKTVALVASGLVLLVAFFVAETRTAVPLVPMRLFRNRRITFGSLVVVLIFFALFGVLFFVTLYLLNVHGYGPVQAGVRVLPLSATFMLACPLGGVLNDRYGPRVAIPCGMLLVSVALAGMWWLEPSSSYVLIWVPFVLLGPGIGPVIVAASDAIVASAPVADAGIAGGLQSTALQIGGVLGTSVLGSVLTTRVGDTLFTKLTEAGVPAALASKLGAAQQLVGQGAAPQLPDIPPALQRAIDSGSHAAFMSGLHLAVIVAAGVSFAAIFVGLLVRDRSGKTDAEVADPEL